MSFTSTVVSFIVYLGLIAGLFWFAFLQRKKRREGRFPMPENMLAMRRPGEQLSADLVRLDDQFDSDFLLLVVLPLLGLSVPLWVAGTLNTKGHIGVLVSSVALLAAAVVFGVRRLLKTVEETRDRRLALYGERVVADRLDELTADGFAVFHDVPCLGGGGRFNLDHVVVGRGGVGVVETKTYRKRPGVNGKDHIVSYDGSKLVLPHGTSTQELQQATDNAEWLRNDLKKHLNLDVPVRAALTLPGWFVKNDLSPKHPVLVVDSKRLPRFIGERFHGKLTKEQEDLVRRHLRRLCETVSFADMPV